MTDGRFIITLKVPGLSRLGRVVSSTVEKEWARTRFVGLESECAEVEVFSASLIGRLVICVAVLDEVVMLESRVSRLFEFAG